MVILGQDTQLPGLGDCLSPVADIQLAENVGRVSLYGSGGNNQKPGDLQVGFPGCNHVEDFQLAGTERLHQPLPRNYCELRDGGSTLCMGG